MAIGRAIRQSKRRPVDPILVSPLPALGSAATITTPGGALLLQGIAGSTQTSGSPIPGTRAMQLQGRVPTLLELGGLAKTPATARLALGIRPIMLPPTAAMVAAGVVPVLNTTTGGTIIVPVRALTLQGFPPGLSAPGGLDLLEGFGAGATGGLGQPVVHVTNLNDSGTGSLRAACTGSNRHIVFDVSGTINLASNIDIINRTNITIDGLSSLSGITLVGHGFSIVESSNMILRDLRIRRVVETSDYIGIEGPNSFNILVDHCSMIGQAFSDLTVEEGEQGDGGFDVKGGAHDITLQWSLLGTAKMSLVGSTDSDVVKTTRRVTQHHNAYIGVIDTLGQMNIPGSGYSDRHPLVRLSTGGVTPPVLDLRQCLIAYCIRANGTKVDPNGSANIVGCGYIPAPATTIGEREDCLHLNAPDAGNPGGPPLAYTSGNVELGSPALSFNINSHGTEGSPFSAPAVSSWTLLQVYNKVGPRFPRDSDETARLNSIASFSPFT